MSVSFHVTICLLSSAIVRRSSVTKMCLLRIYKTHPFILKVSRDFWIRHGKEGNQTTTKLRTTDRRRRGNPRRTLWVVTASGWSSVDHSIAYPRSKATQQHKDVSAGSLLSGGSAAPAQTMGTIRHGRSQRRGGVVCDMDAILLLIALTLISWPASAWAFECIAGETLQVRSNSHRIKPGPCKVKRPLDRAAF